jgi:hypothetical protein
LPSALAGREHGSPSALAETSGCNEIYCARLIMLVRDCGTLLVVAPLRSSDMARCALDVLDRRGQACGHIAIRALDRPKAKGADASSPAPGAPSGFLPCGFIVAPNAGIFSDYKVFRKRGKRHERSFNEGGYRKESIAHEPRSGRTPQCRYAR